VGLQTRLIHYCTRVICESDLAGAYLTRNSEVCRRLGMQVTCQSSLIYLIGSVRFYGKWLGYQAAYLSKSLSSSTYRTVLRWSTEKQSLKVTTPKIIYLSRAYHACALPAEIFRFRYLQVAGLLHQELVDQVVKPLCSAWQGIWESATSVKRGVFAVLCSKTKAMTLSAGGFINSSTHSTASRAIHFRQ